MTRFFVRFILVTAFIVSLGAIGAAFWFLGPKDPSTWATFAAALAVVTSVIGSWTSQRALELQQDAQDPYPYPTVDVESRYGFIQLRVTNYGGGPAHDIKLKWNKPLINSQGKEVHFTKQEGAPEISILLPNETMSVLIDGSTRLFQKFTDMNYTGFVEFKDASGRKRKYPFFLSIEKYRSTLTFAKEEPKTHHELQKIPQEIQKLRWEIQNIRRLIERSHQVEEIEEPGEPEQKPQTSQGNLLAELLEEKPSS